MTAFTRSTAVVRYRDDGPIADALGRAVRGHVPPLLAALTVTVVTVVLLPTHPADVQEIVGLVPPLVALLAAAGAAHPHTGRLQWLAPPLLRCTEYLYIGGLCYAQLLAPSYTFLLIGALVFHHYDTVYRVQQGVGVPRWLRWAALGWDGRMLLFGLAALAGSTVALAPVWILVYFGGLTALWALFIGESVTTWIRHPRDGTQPTGQAIDAEEEAA